MEFFNSLNLKQIKGGTKLKQGDLGSVLSYSLTDENGQEITSFDNKTAYINLVLDDKIWFTTTTLVDISRVTFRIDKAIPIGLYYLEIKIDDYIFPSDRDSIILIEEGSTPYDLKELVPNYDINMTIKGILSDLSQKGIDITNLKSKIDKIQLETNAQLAQKANKDEVTNVMTPKGNIAYASLPTSGNQVGWYYYCPDGDGTHGAGNYVWNGKSWYFGGTGDEGYNLLKKDLDDIDNEVFSRTDNLINPKNIIVGARGRSYNEGQTIDNPYVKDDNYVCFGIIECKKNIKYSFVYDLNRQGVINAHVDIFNEDGSYSKTKVFASTQDQITLTDNEKYIVTSLNKTRYPLLGTEMIIPSSNDLSIFQPYKTSKIKTIEEKIDTAVDENKDVVSDLIDISENIFSLGKNLFNGNKTIGRINENGELNTDDKTCYTSDYIYVKHKTNLTLSYVTDNRNLEHSVLYSSAYAFYDIDKKIIKYGQWESSIIVPDNAYYFRFSMPITQSNLVQCEEGTEMSTYNHYESNLNDIYVNPKRKLLNLEIKYLAISEETKILVGNTDGLPKDIAVNGGITGKLGHRICVKVPSNYIIKTVYDNEIYAFHQSMIELYVKSDPFYVAFGKSDGTDANINDDIKIYEIVSKNQSGMWDCIVAPSDASDEDKAIADIVCDGKNDEEELQYAVNCNTTNSTQVNVLLLDGTFYIDEFTQKKSFQSETSDVYSAIELMPPIVGGRGMSAKIYGKHKEHYGMDAGVKIKISEKCYESMSDDITYSIISAFRQGNENMGIKWDWYNFDIKDLFICASGLRKKIIAIDGFGTTQTTVENVSISPYDNRPSDYREIYFDKEAPVEGSVGIACNTGSTRGVGNYVKGCRVVGMYEGLALVGEHFIVEDCNFHHCWYGFTVGNYPVHTQLEHPNVFIGCSVEQCYRMGLLAVYGGTDEKEYTESSGLPRVTFYYVGGSTEPYRSLSDGSIVEMLPLKEVVKGYYRGVYETDWIDYSPMVEQDGSCKNISIRNYFHPTQGKTALRKLHFPNGYTEGTSYYDTDLGKMLYVHNKKWVDALGNEV